MSGQDVQPSAEDDGNEAMAECMRLLRRDLIAAGVIGESVPPMMMTEAVLGAIARAANVQPKGTEVAWRPEVVAFADAMERKLRANDWKGTWKHDAPGALMDRVHEELTEFRDELFTRGPRDTDEHKSALLDEAADVANMLMMVVDTSGALPAPPPAPAPVDSVQVTALWQAFGRTQAFRDAVKWAQDGEIPGALFVAYRAGLNTQAPAPVDGDARELRKWLNEQPNRPVDRDALARLLHAVENAQPVGEIVTDCDGEVVLGDEVSWRAGMPPAGTKLYAAPCAAVVDREVLELAFERVQQQFADLLSHYTDPESGQVDHEAEGDAELNRLGHLLRRLEVMKEAASKPPVQHTEAQR